MEDQGGGGEELWARSWRDCLELGPADVTKTQRCDHSESTPGHAEGLKERGPLS